MVPHDQTKPPPRFKPGRAVLLAFAALGVASTPIAFSRSRGDDALTKTTPRPVTDPDDRFRRHLSAELADDEGCEYACHAPPSSAPVNPVWQPSYPGSGARMTLFLVEALTGIRTNTDHDHPGIGYDRVSTVKTHYPVKNLQGFPKLDEEWAFDRAVVVMRHPKDAIPSLFNLHYEQMHKLPNHSTRAPQPEWLNYRDNHEPENCNVFCELEKYEQFFDYWMTKYDDRSMLHVFSFEDMISEETGPQSAATLAGFLGRTDGVTPIADESIPCVWEMVVNYKNHLEKLRCDPKSHREGPRTRPYTEEMLQEMLAVLKRLKVKYGKDYELGKILDRYIEITQNTPVEEGLEENLGLDESVEV